MSSFFLLELLFLFLPHSVIPIYYNYIFENSLLVTLLYLSTTKYAKYAAKYNILICFVSCKCNYYNFFSRLRYYVIVSTQSIFLRER